MLWPRPIDLNVSVSHGLNLVLRLKNPHDMPRLLLEISKRQPELDVALRELNFVHFARFLPSPGGEALLVITEFDGELEPYALDFAVAIGDIFTAILGWLLGIVTSLVFRWRTRARRHR